MSEVSVLLNKRKPNGYFFFTDKETGKTAEYYSAQCKHCGVHWQVVPGSGRIRGWCPLCQGITCGQEGCVRECVPAEARVEIWEGKRSTIMKYLNTHFVQEYLDEQKFFKKFMEKYSNNGGIFLKK
jgi:hypothetical protein